MQEDKVEYRILEIDPRTYEFARAYRDEEGTLRKLEIIPRQELTPELVIQADIDAVEQDVWRIEEILASDVTIEGLPSYEDHPEG